MTKENGDEQRSSFLLPMSRRSVLKGTVAFALLASGASCAVSGSSSPPVTAPPAVGKVLLTYRGHTARVTSVMWSADGKRIVSGSLDKTVQVWNAPLRENSTVDGQPFSYRGHSDAVTSVAWSPDSKSIASGSQDKTIHVWDTQGNRPLIFRGHTSSVTGVSWSPDGTYVASSSFDTTVQLWNTAGSDSVGNEKPVLTYRGHSDAVTAVAWSPDGKRIASGSQDKSVQVWDANSGQMLVRYRGHTDSVTTVVWSPDSTSIASGSLDKSVQVWNATSSQLLYRYSGYNVAAAKLNPTKGVLPEIILAVAWSHNGKRLATVTQEYCGDVCGVILIWDAFTERHVSFYPDLPVYALAWSPDDTRLVSTVGTVVQISQAI